MKDLLVLIVLTCIYSSANTQVGVNTNDPEATLDVRELAPNNPGADAGIAVPQVSMIPAGGNRSGQIIFNTTKGQYYFFDGTHWKAIPLEVNTIGDVKYGFQSTDHKGWVKLDGRNLSNLNPNQQSAAADLGFTAVLPDATNRFLKQDSVAALASYEGENGITLQQENLPDYVLNGITSSNGAHSHPIGTRQDDWVLNTSQSSPSSGPSFGRDNGPYGINHNTNIAGEHSHSVSVNSGGSNETIVINPEFLVTNVFIYLGE